MHRNTVLAAYRRLAAEGLVVARPGSGTYVDGDLLRGAEPGKVPPDDPADADREDDPRPTTAGLRFRDLVAVHRRRGGRAGDLRDLVSRWAGAAAGPTVRVVEPAEGMRAVMGTELTAALPGRRVSDLSLASAPEDPGWWEEGPVVCAARSLSALERRAPAWAELIPLPGGEGELRRTLIAAPERSLILVLSSSRRLRETACRAARGIRGRELLCTALDPIASGGDGRLERMQSVAHFVLADVRVRELLRGAGPGTSGRLPLPAFSPRALQALARYLGEEPTSDLADALTSMTGGRS